MMRNRSWTRGIAGPAGAVVVLLSCVLSATGVEAGTASADIVALEESTAQQRYAQGVLKAFTLGWVLAMGLTVGSFLNVVIHRLPRGMPLSRPKSRCPICETPLSRRDNLPVLGWLMLRGRCRYCGTEIPVRYPLVELTVGLLALGLLLGELLRGGANLPVRVPNPTHGDAILWIIWYTKWDLVGLYLFHSTLLTTLLAAVMIQSDGHPLPRRLFLPALAFGLLAPTIWPGLHPVPSLLPRPDWLTALRWESIWTDTVFTPGWPLRFGIGLDGLLDGVAGLLAGGLIGTLLSGRPVRDGPRRRETSSGILIWMLIGAYLGWQAAVSVGLAFALARLLLRSVWESSGNRSLAEALLPVLLTTGQILGWRAVSESSLWVGPEGWGLLPCSGVYNWLATGLLLLAAAAGSRPADLHAIHMQKHCDSILNTTASACRLSVGRAEIRAGDDTAIRVRNIADEPSQAEHGDRGR